MAPIPVPTVTFSPTLNSTITHPFHPSMRELVVPLTQRLILSPGAKPIYKGIAANALSSDGQVEVSVPATALTPSDITSAGGDVRLVIDQIDGPSGSVNNASGSGLLSFGTYEFQLQNAAGHEIALGTGVHQPFTFTLHWLSKSAPIPFGLEPVFFTLNGTHRVDLPHAMLHPGASQEIPTHFDKMHMTLSAIVPLSSTGTGSITASSPVGYFGNAESFQTDLHTGGLNDSIPITVPSGPGGLAPSLHLDYSSDAVSATHNPQAAATWVGMGWNLDPGEITWSESNFMANNSNNTGQATWQNSWTLVDASGNSMPLIPPSTSISTFYDDTHATPTISSEPLTWHTAPESHEKIVSYTNPTVDCTNFPEQNVCGSGSYPIQPPCWRVWLPNGDMEEFGCTPYSVQFFPTGTDGTHNHVSAWKLDLITDPDGNQIHFTYAADTAHNSHNINYPRDIALSSITWDDPTCHNANVMCSSWTPHMEVVFSYNHSVTYVAPGDTACAPNGSLRCDDPASGPTEGTPLITPTEVLNDIKVNVLNGSTWYHVHHYELAYGLHSQGTITDPMTGSTESLAGYLLLEQVTETGTSDTLSYPIETFKYSIPAGEYYEDTQRTPHPDTNCGTSWNTNPSTQKCYHLLLRTYAGFYMSEADNNEGLQQTCSWENLRTNQHGVPAGQNALDPGYCTRNQSTSPCNKADDNGWSHIALASRTATEDTPIVGNTGQQLISTWTYNYDLANLTAQECSDCKVGMYWGDANNGDYLDFYNGRFTGFAFAEVENPDLSLENDYYYSTEGWGVWSSTTVPCHDGQNPCPVSASWDLTNAATGLPYQVDHFDVEKNNSWNLLRRDLTTYTATCPPSGVSGSPPVTVTYWGSNHYTWGNNLVAASDLDNPIAVCDVQATQRQTYLADGTNSPTTSTTPMLQTAMQYNSYGQATQSTVTGDDLGSTPTIVSKTGYIYNDNITTGTTSATGTYIVDRAAASTVDDGSGNYKACTFTHLHQHGRDGHRHHPSHL